MVQKVTKTIEEKYVNYLRDEVEELTDGFHLIIGALKLNNIERPIDKKIISKIIASLFSNFSDAKGRDFVLSIFLSIFLSSISFIIHPADLMIKEPYANNKSR